MINETFKDLLNCFEESFIKNSKQISNIEFSRTEDKSLGTDEIIAIVVGFTGKYKGRILLKANESVIKVIAEGINGEPAADDMELYLCASEFTNIFSGNAVTLANNKFPDFKLRLTPPSILAGTRMEIVTPNITSEQVSYTSDHGNLLLDIGVEGGM